MADPTKDNQVNEEYNKQNNNSETQETNQIFPNGVQHTLDLNKENLNENLNLSNNKFMILDTSNFIRLKPLNLTDGYKYFTTEYIIKEIRDEKARDHLELNRNFIEVKNPKRETMKFITNFAKLSNDLKSLSVPDLSILSLAYDLIKENQMEQHLRKEPLKFEVFDVEDNISKNKNTKQQHEVIEDNTDDGFHQVKKSKKKTQEINEDTKVVEQFENFFKDEGEWITPENIDSKLGKYRYDESKNEEKENINVFICTGDYTVQNLAMKIGMPVLGVDGMKIRKIKNYILKCYTCEKFIFDTSKLFCEECGYNTLMKIGCSIDNSGKLKIFNKKAEARNRGTQVIIIYLI